MIVIVNGKKYIKVFSTSGKVRRHFTIKDGVEKTL